MKLKKLYNEIKILSNKKDLKKEQYLKKLISKYWELVNYHIPINSFSTSIYKIMDKYVDGVDSGEFYKNIDSLNISPIDLDQLITLYKKEIERLQ